MCGRYYIREEDSASDLQEIMDQLNRKGQIVKTGEIFPSDTVPVIANSKSMQPSPFAMPWGFTMPDGKLIINARSETAAEKPMFRDGMQQRRCLLPASHYFEWENGSVKRSSTQSNRLAAICSSWRVFIGSRVTRPGSQSLQGRLPIAYLSSMTACR